MARIHGQRRLKKAFLSGPDFRTWLETAEALHRDLMAKGGLLKK